MTSLILEGGQGDKKGIIMEDVFSTICNWIKFDAHSLRKLSISGLEYKSRQLAFLKSAIMARKSQIDRLDVLDNNKFESTGKEKAMRAFVEEHFEQV